MLFVLHKLTISSVPGGFGFDLNVSFVLISEPQYLDAHIHVFSLSTLNMSFTHEVADPWLSAYPRPGSILSDRDRVEVLPTYSKCMPVTIVD
jgi:hypothetical protein